MNESPMKTKPDTTPQPISSFDTEMVATRQVYEALLPVKEERRAPIIKAVAVLLGVPGYWPVDKTREG